MDNQKLILGFVLVLLLSNCRRNELNSDTSVAEDNNTSQRLWDDVAAQADGIASYGEAESENRWNNCAGISVDTLGNPYPLTFTIDFGAENCLGWDGKERRGSIIYEISGAYKEEGTEMAIIPDDYFVDNYKVEGTKTITNIGRNTQGFLTFSISVKDGIITTPDYETISWESNKTRTWIEGEETSFFTYDTSDSTFLGWDGFIDDVYELEGTASGTSRDGRSFETEITSPLLLRLDCSWIPSGILVVKPDELRDRIIDYGDGSCDAKANVSIGNREYEISLR